MSVRVVVVADTHMPRRAKELPKHLLRALDGADLVVHLGDFTEASAVTLFQSFGPLHAVRGNNDSEAVRALFPVQQRICIGHHTLVLIHGDVGGRTAVAAARAVSGGHAVLFGHSHEPFCAHEGGRLLFNPGSPTDKRWSKYRAFGILDVDEHIEASIVRVTAD